MLWSSRKNCGLRDSITWHCINCSNSRVFFCVCNSFPGFFIIQRFVIWCFSIYFMYISLFSIARSIVLVVLIISHGYSLPISKLFCLKGSLKLKERWNNFLEVLVRVVRSKWFNTVIRTVSKHTATVLSCCHINITLIQSHVPSVNTELQSCHVTI